MHVQSPGYLTLVASLRQKLDFGESEAIVLAKEPTCDYLLIDDLAGRKIAAQMGIKIKGSVGVLLYAKQRQIIPLLQPYIGAVQRTNFRLSETLVERIMREAGE